MQARFRVETTHPFDLLASVGRDCVGAIQLYPDTDIPTVMETLAEPLDEAQIEQLLEGYQEAPLGWRRTLIFGSRLPELKRKLHCFGTRIRCCR